tara:strand:+ start:1981 stop:2367 length:387 start_codon:yes stop_codon:yes gene_type:complete
MYKLEWKEFDECVFSISKKCKNKKFVGVYGFPRGGICIAVALSHSLGLPLLSEPKDHSLIVDDIYDTGYTLEKIRHIKGSETHVWVSKMKPTWWNAYKYIKEKEWVIFPWENISAANNDKDLHYKNRT